MNNELEKIIIVDFGSQYTQLIANLIRRLTVYCEVIPYTKFNNILEELKQTNSLIKGIILSGGPFSVTGGIEEKYPKIDIVNLKNHHNNIPVFGICYGAQLITASFGGLVESTNDREFGNTKIELVGDHNKYSLLYGINKEYNVWMSHSDTIIEPPKNSEVYAYTKNNKIAIFKYKNFYGIQYHPEVSHTQNGNVLFDNIINICECNRQWTVEYCIDTICNDIRTTIPHNQNVIMALSGGVDSTVAAHLIHKAIGNQLTCVVINNGFMRKNEYENIIEYYKNVSMNIIHLDKSKDFYDAIEGVSDPEKKRKIIGKTFIDIFTDVSNEINNAEWLGQGTIYPDVIESVEGIGMIKSHHNVGGLPKNMKLKLLEPLRKFFKDEVREIGYQLNISKSIIHRHPFPGPGLSIRILGEITEDKIKILQEADDIFINKLKEYSIYDKIWQAGVIFLPIRSVGVMGDVRTYENVVALRAITSINGMTADWYDFNHSFLSEVSNTIINNVKGINRVVYDISSKPPATIEWE
jgi:GMP synthase (glutamine-hydrolysing)